MMYASHGGRAQHAVECAEKRAHVPAMAIIALSIAAFAVSVSTRITDPILPVLVQRFGMPISSIASISVLYALAYGAAQLILGPLGDRFGKYRIISMVCFVSVATAVICGAAQDFIVLVGGRLLSGLAGAAIIPLSMAWIGDVTSYEERQSTIARFMLGQILGVSTGAAIGGVIVQVFQWRLVFFFSAAAFLVVGLLLHFVHRGAVQRSGAVEARPDQSFLAGFAHLRTIFGSSWNGVILSSVFLEGAVVFGTLTFVPSYLFERLGLTLADAGLMTILFGVGGAVYALFSKGWVHLLGEKWLVLVGGLSVTLGLFLLSHRLALPVVSFALGGVGFGYYTFHNTLQVNATQMAADARGLSVAVFAASYYFGQATGIAISGMIIALAGTASVFMTGCAVMLFLTLLTWLMFYRRQCRLSPAAYNNKLR